MAAGAEFGLVAVGARAFSSNTLESGWIPSPLLAIYSGNGMLAEYRKWLVTDSYDANNTIAGYFVSLNIEEYYTTPWELEYGGLIIYNHYFTGSDYLERKDT